MRKSIQEQRQQLFNWGLLAENVGGFSVIGLCLSLGWLLAAFNYSKPTRIPFGFVGATTFLIGASLEVERRTDANLRKLAFELVESKGLPFGEKQ